MANALPQSISRERHSLLAGIAAGLVAGAVAGVSERLLDRLVSREQKERDRQVREAPAHQMAGPHFARKIFGKELDEGGKKKARAVFALVYGAGWGMIHAGMRRKFPPLSRWGGLPFAVPFFFFCDGFMAPLLGVSPSLRRIPWQPNAKEMGNHIAWTAAAEMVHRTVVAREARRTGS